MDEFFDSETFGELVEPKPSEESKGRPSITASTIHSEFHSSTFRPKIGGNLEQQHWENDEEKKEYRRWGEERSINASLNNTPLAAIMREIKLKKVSKADNFYCGCNEYEGVRSKCLACGGSGGVDGNDSLVKFMEYLMEFKLGLKGCYTPNKKKEEETAASFLQHNTSIFSGHQNKTILKSNSSISNSARANSFCTDFYKNTGKLEEKQNNNCVSFEQASEPNSEYHLDKTEIQNENGNNSLLININQVNLGMGSMVDSVQNESKNLFKWEIENNEKDEIENIAQEESRDQEQKSFQSRNQRMSLNEGRLNESHDDYVSLNSRSMIVGLAKKKSACRKSLGASSVMSVKEFKEQMKAECSVHCGFNCDNCEMSPIVGTRFHCVHEDCGNDYDLCEKCYKNGGHQHNMEEIKYNKLNKVFNKIENISRSGSKKQKEEALKDRKGLIYDKMENRQSLNVKMLDSSECEEEEEEDEERYIPVFKSSIH